MFIKEIKWEVVNRWRRVELRFLSFGVDGDGFQSRNFGKLRQNGGRIPQYVFFKAYCGDLRGCHGFQKRVFESMPARPMKYILERSLEIRTRNTQNEVGITDQLLPFSSHHIQQNSMQLPDNC